ncbi:hypothetical protein DSD19_01150 [Rhodovulum sp. BSW8]|uniref:CHAD domain-containing protein n=1 Tax=Rhodovulum sp. BSW8 TaxID=2259645 RepID=UPI000DE51083|nr:CHAD domain-containing protein [Rhodovulum sp. BSW8]RBO55078.1 hypothetical protein DSD19_01150 [Rhodovulum sp. BSW8]
MTYRLKRSDKSTEAALRRIAIEEIDAALTELGDPGIALHEKVHGLRKRAKKLRGLIRLVRPAFPAYVRENGAIRDAARRLSGLRDREGMVETFDKLVAGGRLHGFEPVRAHLVAARDRAAAKAHVEEDLAAFRLDMLGLRERARSWALYGDGFRPMRRGLQRTFDRARKGRAAAAEAPEVAVIHDWRKRVKYHWYHTRLLRPIERGPLGRRAKKVEELSELLGDHHDLAVLDTHLAATPDLPGGAETRDALRARIAARQADLAEAAQTLGARLFASPAKDLGRSWKRWWKSWHRD